MATEPGQVQVVTQERVDQRVGGVLDEPELDAGVGTLEATEQRRQVE